MTMVIEIILGLGLLIVSVIAGIFTFKEFKKSDGKNSIDLVLCGAACLYLGIFGLIFITGNIDNAVQTVGNILVMEI